MPPKLLGSWRPSPLLFRTVRRLRSMAAAARAIGDRVLAMMAYHEAAAKEARSVLTRAAEVWA